MIIGVDVSPAAKERRTGIEWYCFHVANQLPKLDRGNQYRYFTKTPVSHLFDEFPSNFREVVLPDRSFWTHTALAAELRRNPVDVFYSPAHIIPWRHPARTVGTIHDAGFRHYRKNYSTYQFVHATVNSWTSAVWSKELIVPAEFVANDVAQLYRLDRRKIHVVPNGFDATEFTNPTPGEIAAVTAKFGLGKPFFSYVGRMEIRKNLVRALQAFFEIAAARRGDVQFVIAGSPGVGFEEIDAAITASPWSHLVVRPGYVTSEEKSCLLTGSRGLVFPSLYEGFGIPILEGFAAHTPVLTSNITACPEVAGTAAIIVDPYDMAAIRRGMETMLDDEPERARLIERGNARVRDFSWERTAREALALLLS
jgi:glycosyltransferase involved in cell wall biosynthesis